MGPAERNFRWGDSTRPRAGEEGGREAKYPPMGRRELAGQTRMDVRGGEHVADQRERGNSYHDRRAAVDASRENILRRVDLRHSDQGHRIAGQDGAIGPVAVQKSTDEDAEPKPAREADQEEVANLRKQPSDHKRGDDPNDGGEDPVDGLLVDLPSRLQGKNADGDSGG